MADILIGRLFGNYQVLARLGKASTGALYRVRHKFLKVDRTMQVAWPTDSERASGFLADAQRLAQVRHKNLARVHESGLAEDGVVYLLLELLTGDTLGDGLVRSGRVEVRAALKALRDVTSGLADAHDAGVIHRNITIDTVLMAREGGVSIAKLVDFGLDLPIDHTGITKLLRGGTYPVDSRFAAPEQLGKINQDDLLDSRTDVYALGLCLYTALTGRSVYDHGDPHSVLEAKLGDPPPPPSEIAPDARIDRQLDELVMSMIEPERAHRPSNARVVADALDGMLLQVRRPDRAAKVLQMPQRPRPVPSLSPPETAPTADPAFAAEATTPAETETARPHLQPVPAPPEPAPTKRSEVVKPTAEAAEPDVAARDSRIVRQRSPADAAHDPRLVRRGSDPPVADDGTLDRPLHEQPSQAMEVSGFEAERVMPAAPSSHPLRYAIAIGVMVVLVAIYLLSNGDGDQAGAAPVAKEPREMALDERSLVRAIASHRASDIDDWLRTFPRSLHRERAYLTLIEWGVEESDVCDSVQRRSRDLLEGEREIAKRCEKHRSK